MTETKPMNERNSSTRVRKIVAGGAITTVEMRKRVAILLGVVLFAMLAASPSATAQTAPPGVGWVSLLNGKDLTGWRTPAEPHDWGVVDGVIDFGGDGRTPGATYGPVGGHLYTGKSYTDYIFSCEWRFKKGICDGDLPDSGIILRGETPDVIHVKHVNLWCNPIGSGSLYAACGKEGTAKVKADKPLGEWNTMEITVRNKKITVVFNGQTVVGNIYQGLKGDRGPIGIQRHGNYNIATEKWKPLSSMIQLRSIWIKELTR